MIGAPDRRLEVARTFGADHTISIDEHPDAAERLELVTELGGGRGPDVVLECSGGKGAAAEAVTMVAANGRVVLIGTVGGPPQATAMGRIVTHGLTVTGSMGGDIDSYFKALEFLRTQRSRFDFDQVLGDRYRLDEITDALHKMQRFEDIKPVIVPNMG